MVGVNQSPYYQFRKSIAISEIAIYLLQHSNLVLCISFNFLNLLPMVFDFCFFEIRNKGPGYNDRNQVVYNCCFLTILQIMVLRFYNYLTIKMILNQGRVSKKAPVYPMSFHKVFAYHWCWILGIVGTVPCCFGLV